MSHQSLFALGLQVSLCASLSACALVNGLSEPPIDDAADASPDPAPNPRPDPPPDMSPDQPPDTLFDPDANPDPDLKPCLNQGACAGQGEVCCDGVCRDEDSCGVQASCASQGQTCRLAAEQVFEAYGAFFCIHTRNFDTGTCAASCDAPYDTKACAAESLCIPYYNGVSEVLLCHPDECADTGRCDNYLDTGIDGTCMLNEGNVGLCNFAGAVPEGERCSQSSSSTLLTCSVDTLCVVYGEGDEGTCRRTCDFWGEEPCGGDQICGLATFGTGLCLDETTRGRQAFDTCEPAFHECGDRSRCFPDQEGADTGSCLAFCRLENRDGDCSGVEFFDQPTFCDPLLFEDDSLHPSLGVCIPRQ